MDTFVCPRGHTSTEPDYCSECGAKMEGQPDPGAATDFAAKAASAHALPAGEVCPDCGTVREQSGIAFCEVCGYNFSTGVHGELPMPAPPPSFPTSSSAPAHASTLDANSQTASPTRWAVTLSVDPSLRQSISPEAPAAFAPVLIALDKPVTLIGRRSEARAIFPEIAIREDDAVSHRHALLSIDAAGGLVLRDIGSSNGTRLNGTELAPMTDHTLRDGDNITLGHWSRITVTAAA